MFVRNVALSKARETLCAIAIIPCQIGIAKLGGRRQKAKGQTGERQGGEGEGGRTSKWRRTEAQWNNISSGSTYNLYSLLVIESHPIVAGPLAVKPRLPSYLAFKRN